MTSHLGGDWFQGAPGLRFRVRGIAGAYVVFGIDGQEDGADRASLAGHRGRRLGHRAAERWGRPGAARPASRCPSERGRWDTYYPAFAAAVRGEGPVPVDPRGAVASLTLIDAIRAAPRSGAPSNSDTGGV